MRILGIDPGLTRVGIGLIEKPERGEPKAIEWLTIETAKGLSLPERLAEVKADLEAYLREAKPDLAVVEKVFFAKNKRTAMGTAQARGVILATITAHGIDVLEVTPPELKVAITGDGGADKQQMQSMVTKILKLKEIPEPADAADALGMALFGALHRNLSLSHSPNLDAL